MCFCPRGMCSIALGIIDLGHEHIRSGIVCSQKLYPFYVCPVSMISLPKVECRHWWHPMEGIVVFMTPGPNNKHRRVSISSTTVVSESFAFTSHNSKYTIYLVTHKFPKILRILHLSMGVVGLQVVVVIQPRSYVSTSYMIVRIWNSLVSWCMLKICRVWTLQLIFFQADVGGFICLFC